MEGIIGLAEREARERWLAEGSLNGERVSLRLADFRAELPEIVAALISKAVRAYVQPADVDSRVTAVSVEIDPKYWVILEHSTLHDELLADIKTRVPQAFQAYIAPEWEGLRRLEATVEFDPPLC